MKKSEHKENQVTMELDIQKLEMAASRLRAIAHPARIAIIGLLQKHKKLNVTEIYEAINLEQAATSHHLAILRNKGIVLAERDGKNTLYSLKHKTITQIIDCINRCNEAVEK